MKDLDKLWVGLVEENKDPDKLGRVKVRVQSVYDDIPLEDIPWANPVKSLSSRIFEIPAIGKIVSVIFPNDNIYEPYYMFSDHYNVNLQKKLKDLSDDEYVNFFAILFDHRTKIYSDDTNLTMDYQYNKITIDNDNINLELKDNNRKVNIGCKTAGQQAVLGNHYFDWMDKFVEALVKPSSLIGNSSAPILKPEIDQLLVEYRTLRETFLSDHVFIVDDNKIDKLQMKYNAPYMDDGVKINDMPAIDGKDEQSKNLKDAVKSQKDKALDELKKAMPTNAIDKIKLLDLPENDEAVPPGGTGDITQYFEIK